MQIARSFAELQASSHPVALTIGSFDGLHPGHKYLLSYMAQLAPIRLVATFDTLPINYFRQKQIPQLTTLEQKLLLLEEAGVDNVLLLPFDQNIAALTYQEFLQNIFRHTPFSHLVLGRGAAFGKDQLGTEKTVTAFAKQLPFTPHYIEKFTIDGQAVSSMQMRREKSLLP